MPEFTLEEILTATGGRLLYTQEEGVKISGVSTDSRNVSPHEVFIALRGEKFDGHDYLTQAVAKGAAALVVEREIPLEALRNVAVIIVPDTIKALGLLARYHRLRFKIPVIGVTGSNGKTTTKELISTILAEKMKVVKTEKNFNNEIGLPMTLLKIDPSTEAVVLEMGMRGRGQIAYLSSLAQPTIGVITNVGVTHLELLGTQKAIAETKAELIQSLPSKGTAVLNGDDLFVANMAALFPGESFYYSLDAQHVATEILPDLYAVEVKTGEDEEKVRVNGKWGEFCFALPLLGRHNIANALAASLVGLVLGATPKEVARGLKKVKMVEKRLRRLEFDGLTILDDTYNASPSSVQAALDVLRKLNNPGRKIAVLGDMLELGAISAEAHHRIGKLVADYGCSALFAYGPVSKETIRGAADEGVFSRHFFEKEELWEELNSYLSPGDAVLVKGSRGMRMEEIVEKIISKTGKE